MVRAKRRRKLSLLAYPRWAAAGVAVTALLVLAISYVFVVHPLAVSRQAPGQRVAHVGLREGYASDSQVILRATTAPKGKGSRQGSAPLKQLILQFQHEDSRVIEAINLQAPREEQLTLTVSDNYRLLLELAADQYVYAFQLTSSGTLVWLYPNEAYGPAQNPLHDGQTLLVPSEPNWLHLGETRGEERLYVIASTERLRMLDDLYDRYHRAGEETTRQEALTDLLSAVDAIRETHPPAASWLYTFSHR
jgi:hypothetical protein